MHCFMGISRSTTVLAAYLMDHENYSAKQAVSQVSLLVSLLWLLWTLSPSSGPCLSPCILHYPSSCATRYTSLSLAFSVSSFSLSVSLFLPFPPLCTARTLRMVKTTIHTQIQKVRTIAQPNPGFMRQLEQYQCLLEQQKTAAAAKKSVGVGIHLARKSVNHTDNLAI